MCKVKTVQMWEASNGQMVKTERQAVLISIAHLIGCSVETVRKSIEPKAGELTNLLYQLQEPRNRLTRAAEQLRLATEEERAIPMEPIDTRTLEDINPEPPVDAGTLNDIRAEGVDPGDLRCGQVIECTFHGGAIGHVRIDGMNLDDTDDGKVPYVIGPIFLDGLKNEPAVDMPRASVQLHEILRIVQQPEDRMDLVTAQDELDRLEARMTSDDDNRGLSPMDHKRRILLNRRIAQLRSENDA
jgi:hypothetical protein